MNGLKTKYSLNFSSATVGIVSCLVAIGICRSKGSFTGVSSEGITTIKTVRLLLRVPTGPAIACFCGLEDWSLSVCLSDA